LLYFSHPCVSLPSSGCTSKRSVPLVTGEHPSQPQIIGMCSGGLFFVVTRQPDARYFEGTSTQRSKIVRSDLLWSAKLIPYYTIYIYIYITCSNIITYFQTVSKCLHRSCNHLNAAHAQLTFDSTFVPSLVRSVFGIPINIYESINQEVGSVGNCCTWYSSCSGNGMKWDDAAEENTPGLYLLKWGRLW
jgi:hypothetical protein